MNRRVRSIGLLLISPVFLLVTVRVEGQEKTSDWPQFRGPSGFGVSSAKGLPVKWSATENVVWKSELAGPGTSSPVIVGDKIYLTYFTGYNVPGKPRGDMNQLKYHVVCLSRTKGNVLWTTDVTPKLPEQPTIRDNHGYASATPVVEGDRLYVCFGKTGVFAFDLAGKQLWQADIGSKLDGFGSAATPVVHGDLVIVNAAVESECLIAFDKRTGKEVWRAKGIRQSWNAPVLVPLKDGKVELVVAMQGRVLGLDPATGAQLWTCGNDIGWYIVPRIVAHEGVVWSIGGRNGTVACAVRAGGRGDVTRTHRLWTSTKGSNVSSPIYHEGRLYWMNDNLGIAYCADADTGKIVYEERVPGASQVYASPVLADGKLYYVARDGRAFVMPIGPKYQLLATNQLGDRSMFNASPAVAGDQLFLRSDRFLYCLGLK